MLRYFARMLRARSWTLSILTIFGVGVGVASVLAIQILNRNSIAAFTGSVRAISGEADLSIVPLAPELRPDLLVRVLETAGVAGAWPLYRTEVVLAEDRNLFLQIVGVDFYGAPRFPLQKTFERDGDRSREKRGDLSLSREKRGDRRRAVSDDAPSEISVDAPSEISIDPPSSNSGRESRSARDAWADALTIPGWAAITPELAADRGWEIGDTIAVTSGARRGTLRVGALVDLRRRSPLGTRNLVLMDIAQVQDLTAHPRRIDQIDVRVEEGRLETVREDLQRALGPECDVIDAEETERRAEGLLGAFRLNLTALSLVSLFVGAFLVFTSTQASLVRRRAEIGLLRALGATRGQVLLLLGGDVLFLASLGVAIGIPLGYTVAKRNVESVSATVSNLYLLTEIDRLTMPAELYWIAACVGLGGAAAGSIWPALDLLRRDARSLFLQYPVHETTYRSASLLAWVATLALALGLGWYWQIGNDARSAGFVLGFLVLISVPLYAPAWVRLAGSRVAARGFGLGLSLRNLTVRLHTVAFAVAGLSVAVAMMVGVTTLIASFRSTLATWIETSVRADVYITTPSWSRARDDAFLDPRTIGEIERIPGIAGIERLRQLRAGSAYGEVRISGVEPADKARRFPLREGDPEIAARQVWEEGGALVSEPLARRAGLEVGDTLRLVSNAGPVDLPISGISYDYSTEGGSALVSLATLERHFGGAPVQNIALYLEHGADSDDAIAQVRARLPGVPLVVRSNQGLRAEILDIFDQTFAITRILQGLALLVALCGISLTLLVLARERASELALYRALGAVRGQVFRLFLGEALTIGLLGLALGTLAGLGLALILIHVINPAFFGWTIRSAWPWSELVRQDALLLSAALLAGIYPAARASRLSPLELTRDAS